MVGPETLVLPVQNGVEAAEQIAAIVGDDHVVMGVGVSGAPLEQPGVVAQKGQHLRAQFGPDTATHGRRAARIRDILNAAGISAAVSPDIERDVWEKFLMTPVALGFMALNRLPLGPTLACPESAEVALNLVEETVAVGRASGAPLTDGAAAPALEGLRSLADSNPGIRGSMYFDLLAGKRLELEAINGAVVRMGQEHGIATPFNLAVYGGLKPYVDGAPLGPA
jgi:2-dehydropantoate 2-reductase